MINDDLYLEEIKTISPNNLKKFYNLALKLKGAKDESLQECDVKFAASPKAVERLKKFIKPEYLELYKDMTDEEIDDMIRTENRLARRNRG